MTTSKFLYPSRQSYRFHWAYSHEDKQDFIFNTDCCQKNHLFSCAIYTHPKKRYWLRWASTKRKMGRSLIWVLGSEMCHHLVNPLLSVPRRSWRAPGGDPCSLLLTRHFLWDGFEVEWHLHFTAQVSPVQPYTYRELEWNTAISW